MTNLDSLPTPSRIANLMIFVVPGQQHQQTNPSHRHQQRSNAVYSLLTHLSTKYCIILPLSNTRISLPSVNLSVRAGIRPLGLISLNQGSFCVSLENWMPVALYGRLQMHVNTSYWHGEWLSYPNSSSVIDILMPFGVCAVYKWISDSDDMIVGLVWLPKELNV